MKQRLGIALAALALSFSAGCDKPAASDCKKAIANIRKLFGTSQMSVDTTADTAWVRSCRGTAKKSSVACAINATSLEQLKTCGLLKAKELEDMEAMERDLARMRTPPAPDAGVAIDAAAPGGDGDGGAAAAVVSDGGALGDGGATTTAGDAGTATAAPALDAAAAPAAKPPAAKPPAAKPPAAKPPATKPPATAPATP